MTEDVARSAQTCIMVQNDLLLSPTRDKNAVRNSAS